MVHWVDLSDVDAGRGFACASEGAGGYDALGSTLRLTVLRSPLVADHGRGWGDDDRAGYPITDQGRHRVRYALLPHLGAACAAGLPRRAAEHRVVLPVVLDTWHLVARARGLRRPAGGGRGHHAGPQAGRGRRWHRSPAVGGRRRFPPTGPPSLGPAAKTGRAWNGEGELGPHEVRTVFLPDDDPARSRTVGIPELDVCPRKPKPTSPASWPAIPTWKPSCPVSGMRSPCWPTLSSTGGRSMSGATAAARSRGLHRGRAHEGHGAPSSGRRGPARPEHCATACPPGPLSDEADYLAARLEGALRAVCLTSQSGLLSAIANDTAGDMGMAQQVHGYGRPGDVFWALSTSGRSRNVVLASLAARAAGVRVLAMTGAAGERLGSLADVWVAVPATGVAAVQELHQPIYHALCAALEERYWPVPL